MRINKILLTVAASALCLCGMTGCKKFLETEAIGKSTIASFFSEYGGVTASGEGLHKVMMKFYCDQYMKYADVMGNQLCVNSVNAQEGDYYLFNYQMKAAYTATYPRGVWTAGYSVLTEANNILYYVPKFKEKCDISYQLEGCDKVIGWAHYARALALFSLCNCYGQPYIHTPDASHLGVPVVTEIPGFDAQIPRETVKDVYKQVLSDLEEAMKLLDCSSVKDPLHVSGIACEALMARVCLYMQDWEGAEKWSESVMGKMSLTPRDNYVAMFRNPKANPGAEAIFRFNSYDNSTGMLSFYDPTRKENFYPDPSMLGLYDSDDIRKELFTYVSEDCETTYGETFSAVCKMLPYKSIADPKDTDPYPFVSRLSEIYLIHAEALACGRKHDLEGAADDLKALIARGKGIDKSKVTLKWNSQAEMEELIQKERMRELCYEGHSMFDCLRRGKDVVRFSTSNASIKELTYPDYRFILPIDELEMEANDFMVQNPGYEN